MKSDLLASHASKPCNNKSQKGVQNDVNILNCTDKLL